MILQRIIHFAETTPDKSAISRHGRELCYGEFASAILSACAGFADSGIAGRGVVAVLVANIQDFWIYSLALRSLGLTTLPLRTPLDLVGLAIPSLKWVIGDKSSTELEQICRGGGLSLAPAPSLIASSMKPAPADILDGGQILLTSGTTGLWKMVLWDAAADKDALLWLHELDEQTAYHVFDYGPWTAAGYLAPIAVWYRGGEIIIHQEAGRHRPLQNRRGTHAIVLPYFLSEILAAPEHSFPFSESLRLYVAGGTVTPSQIQEAKRRICPNIFNRLGATEVGGIACTALDEMEDQRWHSLLPERGVEIQDNHGRAVPPGQVGQLCVPVGRGPSEYYGDPVATAEFFRNGYFYTGDLAVQRGDGRIALEGRVTEVINVNGTKIAPQPFEHMLREKFGFSDVCLLSAQNDRGEEEVHAVVETAIPLDARVAERMQKTFDDVTLKVSAVASLPRTGTGKIMRAQLHAQLRAAPKGGQSPAA